jgi:amidophosphoribosyltransferase
MCGVVGIVGSENSAAPRVSFSAAYETFRGLMALQHRGQDAAGILTFDNATRGFGLEKDLGLVSSVFNQEKIEKLTGAMAIGHTRYATAGTDDKRDIQPMVTGIPFGFGMVHNGNILNYFSLAKELATQYGRQLLTANDLEVLMHYWGQFLLDGAAYPDVNTFSFENIKRATGNMFDTMIGGYAVLVLMAGQGMVAFRDQKGIRPLILGSRLDDNGGTSYCFASETNVLTHLGYKYVRDVQPGEVIFVDSANQLHSAIVRKDEAIAPCMFEWVYFSGAESTVNEKSVYKTRLALGERLGIKARAAIEAGEINPDVVMPVPDTSRPAAITLADVLSLPYREGLIKNRYVARSFILNTQEKREQAVEQKLIPVISEIEGKSILLIDDSIVRGTTSKKLIEVLMKYGAKEVVLGITCPPIRYACYYGIDFPDPKALIASGRDVREIEQWLGVKKVIYLDEEDLRQAIGVSKLCMACVTNKYPTGIAEAQAFSEQRQQVRIVKGKKA